MVEEGVVKPWYGGDVETPQVGVGVAPESANLLRRYSAVIDVIIANEKTLSKFSRWSKIGSGRRRSRRSHGLSRSCRGDHSEQC